MSLLAARPVNVHWRLGVVQFSVPACVIGDFTRALSAIVALCAQAHGRKEEKAAESEKDRDLLHRIDLQKETSVGICLVLAKQIAVKKSPMNVFKKGNLVLQQQF
jgi:hypothetical protein